MIDTGTLIHAMLTALVRKALEERKAQGNDDDLRAPLPSEDDDPQGPGFVTYPDMGLLVDSDYDADGHMVARARLVTHEEGDAIAAGWASQPGMTIQDAGQVINVTDQPVDPT